MYIKFETRLMIWHLKHQYLQARIDSINCTNQKSVNVEILATYVAPPSGLEKFMYGSNLCEDRHFTSKGIPLEGVAFAIAL